jgi:hypothetical protein
MIKRKQNIKPINASKGKRTQRISMIKTKKNTTTINDQKKKEQKAYQ